MGWAISISRTAEKQIKQLDRVVQKRLICFLRRQEKASSPKQQGKYLRGKKKGLWRYRVGDYRLICFFDDANQVINVLDVGHRKAVYR